MPRRRHAIYLAKCFRDEFFLTIERFTLCTLILKKAHKNVSEFPVRMTFRLLQKNISKFSAFKLGPEHLRKKYFTS